MVTAYFKISFSIGKDRCAVAQQRHIDSLCTNDPMTLSSSEYMHRDLHFLLITIVTLCTTVFSYAERNFKNRLLPKQQAVALAPISFPMDRRHLNLCLFRSKIWRDYAKISFFSIKKQYKNLHLQIKWLSNFSQDSHFWHHSAFFKDKTRTKAVCTEIIRNSNKNYIWLVIFIWRCSIIRE